MRPHQDGTTWCPRLGATGLTALPAGAAWAARCKVFRHGGEARYAWRNAAGFPLSAEETGCGGGGVARRTGKKCAAPSSSIVTVTALLVLLF